MNGSKKSLRKSIFLESLVPMVVYKISKHFVPLIFAYGARNHEIHKNLCT